MALFHKSGLLMFGLLLALGAAAVADDAADFSKAKFKIQQKLRNKQVTYRVEGVREASEFVTPEAARMLIKLGLSDQAIEVRKAAYQSLLRQRAEPEIADCLGQEFTRACKAGLTSQTVALVALAAAATDEPIREEVIKTLNGTLGTPKADALLMADLIDNLAEEGSRDSLAVLDTFRQTAHFRSHIGFRRTVVQALTRMRHKQAIDTLVELFPTLQGEMLNDALQHLTAVSGQSFGPSPADWQAWWRRAREGFEFPALNEAPKIAAAADPAAGSHYYRLPLIAKRVVFIIDISRSMEGEKMKAAQQSLIKCVQDLSEDAHFNIVAFHSEVFTWRKNLAPATAEYKRQASNFVGGLKPDRRTATYDALHAATALAPEAIYLVTDGQPSEGKIVAPQEIVAAISRSNRATRISIYTVGIEVEDGGPFLQELATNNWGKFRDVLK